MPVSTDRFVGLRRIELFAGLLIELLIEMLSGLSTGFGDKVSFELREIVGDSGFEYFDIYFILFDIE